MTEVRPPIPGFGGGVNAAGAPNQLAEDDCLGLANMRLDEFGGGSKRKGSVAQSTTSGRIISLYIFYRGSAQPQVLAHMANGDLKYSNNNGVSWTGILTGVDTTNPMSFETFNSKVYMCNGIDNYMSWDGSAAASLPGAPVGKFLKLWKDTMWVAGADDDRVYASDPGDAETFSASNWVDLGHGDGDQIVGLDTDGNVLICPKRRRGFLIYDPVTFANRMYDPDKGAEGHFGFIHFDQNIYYITRHGIAVYLGDAPSQIISSKLDPIFAPDILNFNALNLAWGYVDGNHIGWTVAEAGSSVPTMQIEMLPRSEKKPFTFHRAPWGCFATLRYGATELLLAGKSTGSKLLRCFDGGDDDGVAFSGVVETKWFDLEDPLLWKYLRRLILLGRGEFFVSVLRNYELGIKKTIPIDLSETEEIWNGVGDVWNDGVWGPTVALQSIKLHPDVYGRQFKFRFSDSSTSTGTQTIDVGDRDYKLVRGEWAIYGGVMHGVIVGSDL